MLSFDEVHANIDREVSRATRYWDSVPFQLADSAGPVPTKNGGSLMPTLWLHEGNWLLGYMAQIPGWGDYAVVYLQCAIKEDAPDAARALGYAARLARAAAGYEHLHDRKLYRGGPTG